MLHHVRLNPAFIDEQDHFLAAGGHRKQPANKVSVTLNHRGLSVMLYSSHWAELEVDLTMELEAPYLSSPLN